MDKIKNNLFSKIRMSSISLYKTSVGIILLFLFIYDFVVDDWLLGKCVNAIWTFAISCIPTKIVSNQNFMELITTPMFIISFLIIIFIRAVSNLIQISIIINCLEYAYQKKQIKFIKIITLSFNSIKHAFKFKNFPIFILSYLTIPFLDINSMTEIFFGDFIPEYIFDFMKLHMSLYILFFAVIFVLLILVIKFMFALFYFILYKCDFLDACKKSFNLIKEKRLITFLIVAFNSIIYRITFYIIPILVIIIIMWILGIMFNKANMLNEYLLSSKFAYTKFYVPLITEFMGKVIVFAIWAMLLIIFHHYLEKNNEQNIKFEEENDKINQKKIHTFHFVVVGVHILIVAVTVLASVVMVFILKTDPNSILTVYLYKKIAAHKGYSSIAPENTLEAFEKAIDCKICDYIELDVRATKDNVPIVIHNENIFDMTGIDKSVYDLTLEEIKNIDVKGNYYDTKYTYKNVKIPTLDETLKYCKNKIDLIIEIKASDRTLNLEKDIVELIEKYDYVDNCVIHSSNYQSLEKVKKLNDKLRCGYIIAIAGGEYFYLPYADFFSIEYTFIDSYSVSKIHSLGKEVYAWTVNNINKAEKLQTLDIDCLITDTPVDINNKFNDTVMDIVTYYSTIFNNYFNVKQKNISQDISKS